MSINLGDKKLFKKIVALKAEYAEYWEKLPDLTQIKNRRGMETSL